MPGCTPAGPLPYLPLPAESRAEARLSIVATLEVVGRVSLGDHVTGTVKVNA